MSKYSLVNYSHILISWRFSDTDSKMTKSVLLDTGSNDLWVYMNKTEIQSWAEQIAEESNSSVEEVLSQRVN